MFRAADLDTFAKAPEGRYVAGLTWLFWCAARDLCGFTIWDRPSERDIRELTRVIDVTLARRVPYVSLVDGRRITGIDANAFETLSQHVATANPAMRGVVLKQAVVRPQGLVGAVASGFFAVNKAPYPSETFDDPRSALSWLEAGGPKLVEALDELHAEVANTPPVVRELREYLALHLGDRELELASAARALGLAERTLQRRLQEASTSFQAEENATRMRVAQGLLLDTDMKLTAVAAQVGCASLQHLATLFRKSTGMSPSAWRAHRRGEAPPADDVE